MSNNNKADSEEEALFRSYPYALYFVQSPSTASHSNSDHLVIRNTNQIETTRFTLSHYSSSRGSNNSFLHDKKNTAFDLQSHGSDHVDNGESRRDDGVRVKVGEDDDDSYGKKIEMGWWRYFTFRHSSTCLWICLQIALRFFVSLGFALLVFYFVTKPPTPKVHVKMGGIQEFRLGEGVDSSGVTTKILTCNCSLHMLIDNKSKLFGLHIMPPILAMSFDNIPFAMSLGSEVYAFSDELTPFEMYIGTKNKPMYGAGRSMQDLLESGKGLGLAISMSFTSKFHVIPNIINLKFHHQSQCLVLLDGSYDKKTKTRKYRSNCITHRIR